MHYTIEPGRDDTSNEVLSVRILKFIAPAFASRPEAFALLLKTEIARWAKVMKDSGVKQQ